MLPLNLMRSAACRTQRWVGENWSVIVGYLNWVFWRVEGADFPVSDYPLRR